MKDNRSDGLAFVGTVFVVIGFGLIASTGSDILGAVLAIGGFLLRIEAAIALRRTTAEPPGPPAPRPGQTDSDPE